jgi:putative intracellular protease/amidase
MARLNLTRRQLLQSSAFLGCAATLPLSWRAQKSSQPAQSQPGNSPSPLAPPATGKIPVAFAISDGAVVIDFCGPWEVFQDAAPSDGKGGFHLYTVAEKHAPVETSGGMKILPNYTFENAPHPKVIVIPAQNGDNEAMYRWIRESSKATDVTMSVCTGAFVLAKTGLLSGKSATTHHYAYTELAMQYPDIHVKRGYRFVEEGKIATAGGLTSGMDLAWPCASSSATTAATKPCAPPSIWNIKDKAGSTPPAHPTPSTPKLNPAPDSPAKSAAWK